MHDAALTEQTASSFIQCETFSDVTVMDHRVKVHLQLVRAFLKSKIAFEKQLQQAHLGAKSKPGYIC